MKIISLHAENVKKLRAVSITPDGNMVQITGANGAGKSSVLDAMWMALAGKSAAPSQPVRAGEEEARIRLDLGDLIVTRKFTSDGATSLSVTTADGAKYASPQTMLDKMLGALTFDPLAFTRMTPNAQRGEFARLLGITDQLATLERDRADCFAERTNVNRDLRRAESVAASLPVVEACELVDVSATIADLRAARDHNVVVEKERLRRSQLSQATKDKRSEAQRYRDEAARLIQRAEDCEFVALQEETALSKLPAIADTQDVEIIEATIADAERINTQHRAYTQFVEARSLVQQLQQEADELTAAIAELDVAARALVAGESLPIPDLGVTDDGVTYKGLPLDQASSAEQLRVSVAIAMAMHPKLRVLRIQDGSLLDDTSLALIASMADAHDYQVWVERVGTDAKVGIIMEDGTARVVGAVPVIEAAVE